MYCSDELMDVIKESDERYRVKNELREQKNFSGSTLCKRLKDGIIHMPESKAIFTILI